jgi:hypothetical protein
VEILAHDISTAERKFWRCVESVEQPRLFGVLPKPRLEAVRVVDMTSSNAWADSLRSSREPTRRISSTSKPGRSLVPEDAKKALGHGVRAKCSKMDECREAAARPNDSCLTATYFTKLR